MTDLLKGSLKETLLGAMDEMFIEDDSLQISSKGTMMGNDVILDVTVNNQRVLEVMNFFDTDGKVKSVGIVKLDLSDFEDKLNWDDAMASPIIVELINKVGDKVSNFKVRHAEYTLLTLVFAYYESIGVAPEIFHYTYMNFLGRADEYAVISQEIQSQSTALMEKGNVPQEQYTKAVSILAYYNVALSALPISKESGDNE